MKVEHSISLKSPEEIKILREAGKILAKIIKDLNSSLKSGVTTADVNRQSEGLMKQYGVAAAFKGYRGFPGSVCMSVNDEVVHGIPSEKRVLKEGDVVSLDVGIIYKNYYADTAVTAGIGKISAPLQKLLEVTYASLFKGIEQARVHHRLSDISYAIQRFVESNGFSVVRDFVGHGIGRQLHEEPEVPNFGPPHCGPVLKEGMVLAIEPMVNMGSWKTKVLNDGWTVVTEDGQPSAHFEHTIVITQNGPEILTQ